MFEDGIIAQAVDDVFEHGVAYFSSAGNDARASYESRFRLSAEEGISGPRHDFARGRRGRRTADRHRLGGQRDPVVVQWDQPSLSANGRRGAQSDVDVWFYDDEWRPHRDLH